MAGGDTGYFYAVFSRKLFETDMAKRVTKKKTSKIKRSTARNKISLDFEDLVGKEMYSSWILMLKNLVPRGRTHRLSTVIAGMLYYASGRP